MVKLTLERQKGKWHSERISLKWNTFWTFMDIWLYSVRCVILPTGMDDRNVNNDDICELDRYAKWTKTCRTYYDSSATTGNNSCCTEVTVHNGKVHFGVAHLTATNTYREPFGLSVRRYTLMRFEFDHGLSTLSTIHKVCPGEKLISPNFVC